LKEKTSIAVAILSLLLLIGVNSHDQRCGLTVYASGTPDACGNFIREFRVQQYNGSVWETVLTVTNATYAASMSVSLEPDLNLRFYIKVYFNQSLAASPTQAKGFIKVNMTIAGWKTGRMLL